MSSHSQSYIDLDAAQKPEIPIEIPEVSPSEKEAAFQAQTPMSISIEVDLTPPEGVSPPVLAPSDAVERRVALATPTSIPRVARADESQAAAVPASPREMPPPPPVPIPLYDMEDTPTQDSSLVEALPLMQSRNTNTAPYGNSAPPDFTGFIDPMSPTPMDVPTQETRVGLQQVNVQELSALLPVDDALSESSLPTHKSDAPINPLSQARLSAIDIPLESMEMSNIPAQPQRASGVQSTFTPPAPSMPPQPLLPSSNPEVKPPPAVARSRSATTGVQYPQQQMHMTPMGTQQLPAWQSSTGIRPMQSAVRSSSTSMRMQSFQRHTPGFGSPPTSGQPIAPAHLPVSKSLPPKRGTQTSNQQAHLPIFVTPSKEEIQQVKQIVHLLNRAYQAFEFYPFNHPIVQQFSKQLFQYLQGFFRFREMLELRLDRFQVQYCGQQIFEETSLTNNFVYLLFSDGIRKLIIDSGLTEDEYIRFFMVLHRSSTRRSVTEDTITLLWEQQFAYIRYYLVEDLTEMYLPDLQALYDNLERQAAQGHTATTTQGSQQAVQIMGGLARARLSATEEEQQVVQQLVQEEERGLMQRFLEVVARVLEHGEEVLQLDRLVKVLSQLQPILLSVGEIDHLALCLYYTSRLSKLFAQRNSAQAQEWHQMLQSILRESHSEQVIQKLVTYIDQNPHNESMQKEVFQYIQWLTPPNPDSLLKAFTWASSYATRQLWCRSLAAKYKDNPRQLMSGVISHEPIVVRNTCIVLSEIGHVSVRPLLQRASKHEDPEVRAEATRALLQFGGGAQAAQPQLAKLLKKNLADSNPDVRRSALQGLPQLGQRGVTLLKKLYKERPFDQWDIGDQRLLFDATVRMGQRFPESIELMVQAVLKQYSGWLASRKDPTTAREVIQSLQRNSSPRAIAAIEKLYQEGSDTVRNACEFVTHRLS